MYNQCFMSCAQDWAASLGFKMPGGVPMPPDLNIKQADFLT
jgi:hypothetical protein